jgi:2-oxoisovalerate dehydrogenase E1 component
MGSKKSLDRNLMLGAYRQMLRARLIDEKTIILYKQNKCHFQISCAGHEGVQVAAAQIFRAGKDWFYPYYRDMALCAALGMSDEDFMLNAMNKQLDPNSHGRQMPMHYGHKGLRILNQSSPTGTQFLQAVGCAMAIKHKHSGEVVYVSSGEAACAQGDFHEALNWAARESLPIVFLIENNQYGISVHVSNELAGGSAAKLVAGYQGLTACEVDGTDFLMSLEALRAAHSKALKGRGPSLVEAHVVRLESHSISDNQLKYRDQAEVEEDRLRCPLRKLRNLLLAEKICREKDLQQIEAAAKLSVDQASEWAAGQADCDPAQALRHNYCEEPPLTPAPQPPPAGPEVHMVDALNHALDEELQRNPDMFVFGQDVAGSKGGVFGVTAGLTAQHGENRVFNAPLAESSIVGVALGMASYGLKPVAEIQFGDYIWTAMMQLRNEMAMLHYRSGGDFSCPAVIRVAVGGYISGGPYHSQNIEGTLAHFPGLHVVYPSNAGDAKGLLKTAIRGRDPVLFLEHKGLYRQPYAKSPEGGEDFTIPLGKARIVKSGSDATLVAWGALIQKSLLAAQALEQEGFSVEVIDLRTIVPLDVETVFESVKKTGRALIAHEDVLFMGFGAEVAAQISEDCFRYLDAPVRRLGMRYAACVPHSPALEAAVLPQNQDLSAALRELLRF